MSAPTLIACRICGLVQRLPAEPPPVIGQALECARCAERLHTLDQSHASTSQRRVLALSLAALILYPAAMALPVMRLERLGHGTQTTIWGGAAALIRDGHAAIGLLVLVCSIVIPLAKLLALIGLSWPGLTDRLPNLSLRHRHLVYRMVEWLGRWGMVDVLLVAVLIAAVKLGDVMTVRAGPGVTAFGGVVILSLLASACFDPGYIWRDAPTRDPTSLSRRTKPVER